MTTENKNLKTKAVKIQGKDYVLVSDRIIYFNETYPDGSIITELISAPDDGRVVIKATVYPDKDSSRQFTGYSQAVVGEGMVNKSAALENAETSAVGRALGMMGIGVIESIASADEMNKAFHPQNAQPVARNASVKQIELLVNKVKWGLNMQDKDQIVAYIDNAVGKPLQLLKAPDIDEAIKKLDEAIRESKVSGIVLDNTTTDTVIQVDGTEPINLDDLPY